MSGLFYRKFRVKGIRFFNLSPFIPLSFKGEGEEIKKRG